MQLLHENIECLKKLPMFKNLIRENKKLVKKNKELKQLIKLITRNVDLLSHEPEELNEENIKLEVEGVAIKIEPGTECILDDEVIFIEKEDKKEVVDLIDELESDTNSDILKGNNIFTEKKYNEKVINVKKYKTDEKNKKQVEVEEEEEEEPDIVFKEVEMTEEEFKKLYESSEEEEVEVEEEEEEVEVVEEEEEEEGEEVEEITINNKLYYTNDKMNGIIYDIDENGDVGKEVGKLKNGVHKFKK